MGYDMLKSPIKNIKDIKELIKFDYWSKKQKKFLEITQRGKNKYCMISHVESKRKWNS